MARKGDIDVLLIDLNKGFNRVNIELQNDLGRFREIYQMVYKYAGMIIEIKNLIARKDYVRSQKVNDIAQIEGKKILGLIHDEYNHVNRDMKDLQFLYDCFKQTIKEQDKYNASFRKLK